MKIALCSSHVPMARGGHRHIVDWLGIRLEEFGHRVETVYVPQIDSLNTLFRQFFAYRWMDFSWADRVICFRPSAHFIRHDAKIVWFIHHIRFYYDLWGTSFSAKLRDPEKVAAFRNALHAADTAALREARRVFAISKNVADRLRKYNGVESEVLYQLLLEPEKYHSSGHNDEIVYLARVHPVKRQWLLIEAMRHVKSPVKLRICGACDPEHEKELRERIRRDGTGDRIVLDFRWIDESEKLAYLSNCLAAASLPFDEDSFGYVALEAAYADKAILTASDAGGLLDLVWDGFNGLVAEPTPEALGLAMDRLYLDRAAAIRMGRNNREVVARLALSWPRVIERLLS